MEERKCPLCKQIEGRVIFRSEAYGIRKCRHCALMYTVPFPGSETLRAIYESLYRPQQESDLYKEDFLKGYHREGFDAFSKILAYILREQKGGKLLEVGCNYGLFLQMAQQSGFEVCGIDIVDSMIRYVREVLKLPIIQGRFEEISLKQEEFDVITMLDSLEHVEEPLACVEKAARSLKQGGILVISVPNTFVYLLKSRILKCLPFWDYEKSGKTYGSGATYNEMDLPLHLNHFTKHTLSVLLHRAGFKTFEFSLCPEKFPYGHSMRILLRKKYIIFSEKFFKLTRINIHSKFLVIAKK